MDVRNHVVITGTGRAGTTFLVELLTHLGLDTGFSVSDLSQKKDANARAGLEEDIRKDSCPYFVKSPWFCDYADSILGRADIVIDHVFVPMRDLAAAAESRRHVTRTAAEDLKWFARLKHRIRPSKHRGGLWHTASRRLGRQEEVLLRQVYKLMLALSDASVPVTLIRYPRLLHDSEYLYQKLSPILGDIGCDAFSSVHSSVARPELAHQFTESDQ